MVAVFPFLSVNFGCARQAFIRRLTRVPLAAALLAGVLHLLPLAVRCLLVSLYAGDNDLQLTLCSASAGCVESACSSADATACTPSTAGSLLPWLTLILPPGPFNKEAEQATAEIISFATVRNALHMGGHEFKDLAHGVAWQPLQHLGKATWPWQALWSTCDSGHAFMSCRQHERLLTQRDCNCDCKCQLPWMSSGPFCCFQKPQSHSMACRQQAASDVC